MRRTAFELLVSSTWQVKLTYAVLVSSYVRIPAAFELFLVEGSRSTGATAREDRSGGGKDIKLGSHPGRSPGVWRCAFRSSDLIRMLNKNA